MATLHIWTNRLSRELETLDQKLPPGVTLLDRHMDREEGICRALFQFQLPLGEQETAAPDADAADLAASMEKKAPLVQATAEEKVAAGGAGEEAAEDADIADVSAGGSSGAGGTTGDLGLVAEFRMELDLSIETRYPFDPPRATVIEGAEDLPPGMTSSSGLLVLPDAETWTPSDTIVSAITALVAAVRAGRAAVAAAAASGGGGGGGDRVFFGSAVVPAPGRILDVDALDTVFPCRIRTARGAVARHIAVADEYLLELEAHRTRINQVVIVAAHSLRHLAKLRFQEGHSVVIVLKGIDGQATGPQYEFFMSEAGACVRAVAARLEVMGITGRHSDASTERQAKAYLARLDACERRLEQSPSVDAVRECMDLFRQTIESLAAAGNDRHMQVMERLHTFLQRDDVTLILESAPPDRLPPAAPAFVMGSRPDAAMAADTEGMAGRTAASDVQPEAATEALTAAAATEGDAAVESEGAAAAEAGAAEAVEAGVDASETAS